MTSRRTTLALGLLLLFTFARGVLWANVTAPLDAPDEPSHFNYVVQIREGYRLPVVDLISPGGLRTPPSTPLNQDVRDYFARYDYKFFRSMPYESAQPPLYYWMAALWTVPIPLSAANLPTLLQAVRLLSVLFGTGAVFALWAACRWIAPGSVLVWLAPVALTLSPEFSFTTATVSNDAGVIFWGAALLAIWSWGLSTRYAQNAHSPRRLLALAALAGLITAAGLLTKLTFVATLPATLLWLFWIASPVQESLSPRGRSRAWFKLSAVWAGIIALLVGPWVVRNMMVYGEPTGARAIFNLIHRIYWDRQHFPDSQLFSQFPVDAFIVRSFRSFWALFGWATVWLNDVVYWLLAGFAVTSIVGLLTKLRGGGRQLFFSGAGRLNVLCCVTLALAFVNYLGYNSLVEFQPHMRYTFVALAPAMLLISAGFANRGSIGWRKVLLWAFVGALVAIQGVSLFVLASHTAQVLNVVGK